MTDQVKPKRTYVTILAVQNGYVVCGSSPLMRDARFGEEDHVFETFDAMVAFLRDQIPLYNLPPELQPWRLGPAKTMKRRNSPTK